MSDNYIRVITFINPTLGDLPRVIVCRDEETLDEQMKRLLSIPYITDIHSTIARIY